MASNTFVMTVLGVLLLCLSLQALAHDVTDDVEDGFDIFDERNFEETFDDELAATDEDISLEERKEVGNETTARPSTTTPSVTTRPPTTAPPNPNPCEVRTFYSRSYNGVYYTTPVKNTVCRKENAACDVPQKGRCQTRSVVFLAHGSCRRWCRFWWCRRRRTVWFFARRRECVCAKKCSPVLCQIYCPCGNVVVDGCPICKCKRCPKCPPLCKNLCPCGRIYDNNGCPTCRCQTCG